MKVAVCHCGWPLNVGMQKRRIGVHVGIVLFFVVSRSGFVWRLVAALWRFLRGTRWCRLGDWSCASVGCSNHI